MKDLLQAIQEKELLESIRDQQGGLSDEQTQQLNEITQKVSRIQRLPADPRADDYPSLTKLLQADPTAADPSVLAERFLTARRLAGTDVRSSVGTGKCVKTGNHEYNEVTGDIWYMPDTNNRAESYMRLPTPFLWTMCVLVQRLACVEKCRLLRGNALRTKVS